MSLVRLVDAEMCPRSSCHPVASVVPAPRCLGSRCARSRKSATPPHVGTGSYTGRKRKDDARRPDGAVAGAIRSGVRAVPETGRVGRPMLKTADAAPIPTSPERGGGVTATRLSPAACRSDRSPQPRQDARRHDGSVRSDARRSAATRGHRPGYPQRARSAWSSAATSRPKRREADTAQCRPRRRPEPPTATTPTRRRSREASASSRIESSTRRRPAVPTLSWPWRRGSCASPPPSGLPRPRPSRAATGARSGCSSPASGWFDTASPSRCGRRRPPDTASPTR